MLTTQEPESVYHDSQTYTNIEIEHVSQVHILHFCAKYFYFTLHTSECRQICLLYNSARSDGSIPERVAAYKTIWNQLEQSHTSMQWEAT